LTTLQFIIQIFNRDLALTSGNMSLDIESLRQATQAFGRARKARATDRKEQRLHRDVEGRAIYKLNTLKPALPDACH
jgi:hypothetical protein